jgi:hypothetical protein
MPGTNFESEDDNFDAQDVAETLDEDKFSLRDTDNARRTFEELPEVLDVTTAEGDAGGFDEAALDEGPEEALPASDPVSLTPRED